MSKRRTLSVYRDYSKAFDTVQHHAIVQKLHKVGFSTSPLKWFISYLGNRSQYVQVNDSKSATKLCHFGVPQGSVLGPMLCNLYVTIYKISFLLILYKHVNTPTILHNTSTSKSHRFDKLSKTLKSVWTI